MIVSLCLSMLTGCSTKIAYNFLGFYLRWKVSSYVSLDREQKTFVKSEIKAFIQWHRHSELALYANYIDGFGKSLSTKITNKNVTAQYLHAESDKVQEFLDTSSEKLIPSIVTTLSSLNDKQVTELLENLQKERDDYNKEFVITPRSKVKKKHIKDIRNYARPFFGRLTQQQKSLIEQWAEELVPYEHLSLAQQEESANTLSEGLKQRHNKKELEKVIRKILFYRSDEWLAEYQQATDENQRITFQLLADLFNSLTPKQHKRTLAKLHNYKMDFLDLANAARKDEPKLTGNL